jgi:hypothetical protein
VAAGPCLVLGAVWCGVERHLERKLLLERAEVPVERAAVPGPLRAAVRRDVVQREALLHLHRRASPRLDIRD